jgi:1,3-beta-galactosyl-N-acetylhexosamine phosphorylase
MSWDADEAAKDALPWAERLGANELVTPSRSATPEGMKAWQEAGYHTAMLSGVPIHAAEKESPDHLQFGYWTNDPVVAEEQTVALKVVSPTWGGLTISTHFEPKEHWLVLDATADEPVPADRWEYDPKAQTLTISGAEPGHSYGVYFMMQTSHIGDPLYEPFAQHGLAKLDELIAPLEGVLETYWYDDLGYAYPGPTPQGIWDWESYTNVARPEHREAFTAATGIEFDPRWLVMPPRTLDVPPRPEYFAWMSWVQEGIRTWMQRATKVCHDRGIRTWLYWGDCHVGVEPFLGSLTAGNVDEVDKPTGDPVTARALVDFPGDIYRRMRVDWLHSHVVSRTDAARRIRDKWDNARRGLLMAPVQGLYWMPFPLVAKLSEEAVREDLVEKLAQINDEFRLIARHLSGHRAYESDLDLYVVHSWGRQYSWRPWGDRILTNLTDLPVRVRFISFREVIAEGVPEDADALFLYGMPNTAWSGGYVWEDEALARAMADFVRAGGGLVGLQAPSRTDLPEPRWALADIFGVTGEGAEGYEAQPIAPEELAAEALAAVADEDGLSLVATAERGAQALAWEAAELHIPGMAGIVRVATISDDVTVAYALEREDGDFSPGLTFREVGEGRGVHVCGYSREYAFYRLLRAAIYWAANREAEARQLEVEGGENLFIYAYPDLRIIALLSTDDEPAHATIRCAPTVLGLPADAACQVFDLVTEEELSPAANLAQGLAVTTVPHCVRLLRVRGAQ